MVKLICNGPVHYSILSSLLAMLFKIEAFVGYPICLRMKHFFLVQIRFPVFLKDSILHTTFVELHVDWLDAASCHVLR